MKKLRLSTPYVQSFLVKPAGRRSTMQCSKLQPFWPPWQVEKIFGDQNSGESWVIATILQLKVAKRQLFEKVSLERCHVKSSGMVDSKLEFSLNDTNLGMVKPKKISPKMEVFHPRHLLSVRVHPARLPLGDWYIFSFIPHGSRVRITQCRLGKDRLVTHKVNCFFQFLPCSFYKNSF